MVSQELSPADWGKRNDCCNAILTVVPFNGIVWGSDEAHFHICGTVNKQNVRYWAGEKPQTIHQRPLRSPKIEYLDKSLDLIFLKRVASLLL